MQNVHKNIARCLLRNSKGFGEPRPHKTPLQCKGSAPKSHSPFSVPLKAAMACSNGVGISGRFRCRSLLTAIFSGLPHLAMPRVVSPACRNSYDKWLRPSAWRSPESRIPRSLCRRSCTTRCLWTDSHVASLPCRQGCGDRSSAGQDNWS